MSTSAGIPGGQPDTEVARYRVGQVVDGRYQVQALLGEGGMGEAYRACDRTSGQLVVLKLPHLSLAGDMAAFNRYRREIEIGEHLHHPGIQQLLSDPRTPYMVLEYIDGQTLREVLRSRGRLPIDQVVRIAIQLAETLAYVHAQGIVHRDLKPDNVFVTADGHVKLADFGIALRLGSRRLTFSHLSNAVGTPDYMAPEQVRGERGDARTDVYALGAMLYELLTGEVPYPTADALDAMRRRVEADPPLVRRGRPDAPPGLEAVIYRALRRRPEERYPSMGVLRFDLEHLGEVPIPEYQADEAAPPPLGDLPPWRKTAPVLLILFGALGALGVLAEVVHRAAGR